MFYFVFNNSSLAHAAFSCDVSRLVGNSAIYGSNKPQLTNPLSQEPLINCPKAALDTLLFTAGYGYAKVPSAPGSHVIEVSILLVAAWHFYQIKTWRPIGSLQQELSHFFVGRGHISSFDFLNAKHPINFFSGNYLASALRDLKSSFIPAVTAH
jgi:hypothetical protein